jgi:hypothetical protein
MKTPMHNYFKGMVAEKSAYYPYSIFSRKAYDIPPKNDLRMQYLFNTYHTIGHAALIAIFLAALLVSGFFKYAEPLLIFIIYVVTLPLLIMLLNWGIARVLFKDLHAAGNPIGFKQRLKEIFSQSHDSKLISSAGVIVLLALLIFIPSPEWIKIRIWIAAICFYDLIISWII